MMSVTKIFHFESAHALLNYPGTCAQIHGHSYELHVTVMPKLISDDWIPGLGIVMDFKILKSMVQQQAIVFLDHKLILSKTYLEKRGLEFEGQELMIMEAEPSAENLLLFIKKSIAPHIPADCDLTALKLFETRDSYAEWSAR